MLLVFLGACATQSVAPTKVATVTDRKEPRTGGKQLKGLVETQQRPTTLSKFSDLESEARPKERGDLILTQSDTALKKRREKGPLFSISSQDVDIKTVLFSLSKEIDKNIQIEPDINKKASVDLKDVTLSEALDGLLTPLRLKYVMDDKTIRVSREKMETRILHLNYIVSTRRGSSNLQSSSGSAISSGGSSGSSASSTRTTSNLNTSEETNVWNEITQGLQRIITPGGTVTSGTTGGTTGGASGGASGGTTAGTTSSATTGATSGTGTSTAPPSSSTTETGYVTINRQGGIIVVKDFPDILLRVAEFLEAVEGSTQRQVFIQAKILEVVLNENYQLGIDWSAVSPITVLHKSPANTTADTLLVGASKLTYGLSNAQLNLVIDALSTQGNVSVLSSPKIATLNNQRAVIKVGKEDVFFVPQVTAATTTSAASTTFTPSTVTIGIILDVLPQINENGMVMMSINTSISEKSGEATSPDGINKIPILDVRESNNVVLARSGQAIIIGGLMKNKSQKENSALPILGDIPILGRLFQREKEVMEKTELVIMLTPEVMVGEKIDDRFEAEKRNMKKAGSAFTLN